MKEATSSHRSLNTVKRYLGLNGEDYWHIDYPVHKKEYDGQHYFLDISKKAGWYQGKFDDEGIYLYQGADGEEYYSVINLAQYTIGSYLLYLKTGEAPWREEFIKHCDWLAANQEEYKGNKGVWINKYPMQTFGLEGEWISSLSQAFGISALTRAYQETGTDKYLTSALQATDVFFVPVSEGGIYREQPSDFVCFEEYTTEEPSCVLNGHIFSLWALYDIIQLVDESSLKSLYNKAVSSLTENISRWDVEYWSRYDLYNKHFNVASFFYHSLHIKQLRVLYRLTGEEIFKKYAAKWVEQKNSLYCRGRALVSKISFRLNN